VQSWHASPRNAVWEFVATTNAEACLQRQRAALGLVGHTHVPAAWQAQAGRAGVRTVRVRPDRPLDMSQPKWMLNPGAVGAPLTATAGWCEAVDDHASRGAWWLQLDLDARVATWRRAPYDPAPTIERIRAAGLAPSQTASPSRLDPSGSAEVRTAERRPGSAEVRTAERRHATGLSIMVHITRVIER
jgi:hypothetical protein